MKPSETMQTKARTTKSKKLEAAKPAATAKLTKARIEAIKAGVMRCMQASTF